MINGVTEEGHPIQLPPVADRTFHLLKQKLVQAPVLGLPNDFSKGFVLETAVFMQSKNLVAYLNKHLCPRNQASSRSVWQSLWQLLTNGGHTCSTVKSWLYSILLSRGWPYVCSIKSCSSSLTCIIKFAQTGNGCTERLIWHIYI